MKILLETIEPLLLGAEPGEGRPDREFDLRPEGDGFRLAVGGAEQSVTGQVGAVTRAIVDGRPVEASVRREGETIVVEYHGRRYEYRARDARAPKLARRRHEVTAAGELHAPMPGLVVEVFAALGDRVEAGSPLVVVEAMKMQNALPAPLSGRVTAVSVSAGTPVESGALLLTVTPDEA
ncbi:MAG TPA: biotin/lipoyl-containing protein [Candidatus Eisenbacteria bacterium]|nr:biotin/lipoyl-containing protein [Candidatus Eisenbacteria bacterium]